MKTHYIVLTYMLVILTLGFLVGCSGLTQPIPTLLTTSKTPTIVQVSYHTLTPTNKIKHLPTVTSSPIQESTSTPTQSSTVTQTSLSPELVKAWILDRIGDNGGCRLPCWWGMVPGKTTWTEARSFLTPYASDIYELKTDNGISASISFFPAPPEVTSGAIFLGFGVKDGVIQAISVEGIELIPAYHLPQLMETYGEPEGVWVDAYSPWANDAGPRHMALHVFYPDLGIFAQYDAPDGEAKEGMLRNCFRKGPLLELWSPGEEVSYGDAIERLGLDFQFPFLPVSEALGMDIRTFYHTYKDAQQEVCLETRSDLWLWGATPTP